MGYALWIDAEQQQAWAQGTHEYRPMGVAVIAVTDQFRRLDFRQEGRIPRHLEASFVGFFGSIETVNHYLSEGAGAKLRRTPAHLL